MTTRGRHLTQRPKEQQEALPAARTRQKPDDFRACSARRAGSEGTFPPAIRLAGLRRSRDIGLAKTHLQHLLTAVSRNRRRGFAWREGDPLARTRVAPLVALLPLSV